ncbi:MAG: amidase family protein [Acidimicrobiales bacterium]|jgi:amidase
MDLSLLPATQQADLARSGMVSARELLDACVDRYQRHNDELNAVVVERIELAQGYAAELDRRQAAGDELGPLHGVPMTVKDVIDWTGTPSTWGDPVAKDYRPVTNAVLLDRLFGAGVVVWGKTNVPVQLAQWQTFNDIYGRTNNPWDLERTPGGSSGGSAAAIAVGMAGLEIGSDIGGSIRFPAHYCGIFGHKPTFGVVPSKGHNYPGQEAVVDINVCGPLARTANDLEAAMAVLSTAQLPVESRDSLSEFTVGVMLENPLGEQDDELTVVLESAVAALISAGVSVTRIQNPVDHVAAQELYCQLVRAATSALDIHPDDAAHARRFDQGDRDYRAAAGKGASLSHLEWIELHNQRERLREQWAAYFGEVDLLLCPPAASAATPHDTLTSFGDQMIQVNGHAASTVEQWLWAGIASGPYLPATIAPVGLTVSGLPVGIQILAPDRHDLRSIRFAALLERELGGFVPPPITNSP